MSVAFREWGWVLLAVAAAGCGDDGAAPREDAGEPDAGPAVDSGGPMPEVALPDFGRCAEGWRRIEDGEAAWCDPWPEAGIAVCSAVDEAHFPGEPGCVRVGTACPAAGGFAEGLPAVGVVYVDAAAAAGGDGSMGAPFATAAAGLAAAGAGQVVALAPGRYEEILVVPAGVTLWGACARDTIVSSAMPAKGIGAVITAAGADVVVRNLTVTGDRDGIATPMGATLELTDVVVSSVLGFGIYVDDGGTLRADGLVVRDGAGAPRTRYGMAVYFGTAEVARAVIDSVQLGCDVRGGDLVLERVAVRGTTAGGVMVQAGADAMIGGLAADGNTLTAVRVAGGTSTATIRDSVLQGTVAAPADPAMPSGFSIGAGLHAEDGAQVRVERTALLRNSVAGVWSEFARARVTFADVLVQDTLPGLDGLAGVAVLAEEAGELRGARMLFRRNHHFGLLARMAASVDVEDLTVDDTLAIPSGAGAGLDGRALQIDDGSSLTVRRGLLRRSRDAAVAVDGATVTLEGVRIAQTLPEEANDRFGHGLQASGGSTVVALGVGIEDSRGAGIAAFHAGTHVELRGSEISRTREMACVTTTCAGAALGYAVSVADGADLLASDFVMAEAAALALQLQGGGTADLHRGRIADTPIAFNIQTAGFDESRLRDGVSFSGIATEVDRSALPTPVQMPPIDF